MHKTAMADRFFMSLHTWFQPGNRSTFQQKLLVMKLTVLLFFAFLGTHATGVSQTVTLSGKDMPLKQIFASIKEQTGYVVFFGKDLSLRAKPISLDVTNMPVGELMNIVLKDQPFGYRIEGKTISIFRKTNAAGITMLPPGKLSGVIKNMKGEVLEGVTVRISGNAAGVLTNSNGNFTLDKLTENTLIQISSVGYETLELRVRQTEKGYTVYPVKAGAARQVEATTGQDIVVSIQLEQSVSSLDEVVINKGYYLEDKRLSTGSVSKVSSKEIERQPVNNPLQALQGRATGVEITQQSGIPGAGFKVQIRGRNSIRSTGNNALYIVDGVPYPSESLAGTLYTSSNQGGNALSAINPADIESIEILKDADATAIYGSRGANGVVLITTKRGRAGATNFDLNVEYGVGRVSQQMELMNTAQYLDMRREAHANDGIAPEDYTAIDLKWDTARYTNWQDVFIGGTAHITNIQGTLSGGNIQTQFLLGGGYYRETPVYMGKYEYQKASGHVNIQHASADRRFKAGLTLSFVLEDSDQPNTDPTDNIQLPPNAPALYTVDGRINWEENPANPAAGLLINDKTIVKNLINSLQLQYELLPGLTLKTRAGYNMMVKNKVVTIPSTANPPSYNIKTGSADFLDGALNNWIVEPQIDYETQWGPGKLSAFAGITFQQSVTEHDFISASNFQNDETLENLAAGTINYILPSYVKYLYNAGFARINYNWKNKYILNLTGRRDGSSRFGEGNQFANFGALGAAWLFSGESFIRKAMPALSSGKLRASYGTTGNDQIPDYEYMCTFAYNSDSYQGTRGLIPQRLGNPNYQWEVTRKAEIALEAGFLEDRIVFAGNYYLNTSSNQLVGYPLPAITGFRSIQANLPATVRNTGVELDLSVTPVRKKDISWSSQFNISIPRNKLVTFPGIAGTAYANNYEVGKSLYTKKDQQFKEIDPATGLYAFVDVNGNGITGEYPGDLMAVAEIARDYYGGFNNIIRWKTLELEILFQFVKQTNYNYFSVGAAYPGSYYNKPTAMLDRWKKPGDQALFQRASQDYGDSYSAFSTMQYSDASIGDASFIRLRTVSANYTLPQEWTTRMKLKQLSIYARASNLFTITDYFGWDPESGPNNLPPIKMLTAGIKATL